MSDHDRILDVKARIEELKGLVLDVQNQLSDRNMVDGRGKRMAFLDWNARKQDLKKKHAELLDRLRAEKHELRKLSGTGEDPKWELIKKAYVILSQLDEQGVDIGERGHALIDDIEFHVPFAKLQEAMENT